METTYGSNTTLTLSGEDINVTTTGIPFTENITITINTSGGGNIVNPTIFIY